MASVLSFVRPFPKGNCRGNEGGFVCVFAKRPFLKGTCMGNSWGFIVCLLLKAFKKRGTCRGVQGASLLSLVTGFKQT